MSSLREAHRLRTTAAIVDAALDLFAEHGRDEVTVGTIAATAGVGERTLYRYFADKDDILFSWDGEAPADIAQVIADRPEDESPVVAMSAALTSATSKWEGQRQRLVLRAQVISESPHLRDREAVKMAGISAAVAGALAARGVEDGASRLLAAVGAAAFTEGQRQWLASDGGCTLSAHVQNALTKACALLESGGV